MKLNTAVCLLLLFCSDGSWAEIKLPDLGNPSDKVLSPDDEQRYRQNIKEQMFQFNFVMTDPVVASYIYHLGYQLASFSGKPEQAFDFYMVPANVINASAYPGGLVVVYSGLLLETDSESELAGVLSHEIAHVNQRHISRMMAKQQKSTVPILLGMLAAVAASQSTSGDAPIAIAASMSALQQQMAINFTRYHEIEADRVGINTLYQAGLDPEGMAKFFAKMMQKNRVDPRYQLPEYLSTHPLSINRVTEAKNRIKSLPVKKYTESDMYAYVKERVRVLTADEFIDLGEFYGGVLNATDESYAEAKLYGLALYQFNNNEFTAAMATLDKSKPLPSVKHLVDLLRIEILAKIDPEQAKQSIDAMLKWNSNNETVLETTANILLQSKSLDWLDLAIKNFRKLVVLQPNNPHYYELLSIAYYNALKPHQAGEAMARKEHLMGRNYRAVRILRNLKKDQSLDYYQSSIINALIAEYEPLITDNERQEEIAADRGINR